MNSLYCCVRNVDCCRCCASLVKPNVSIKLQSGQTVLKEGLAARMNLTVWKARWTIET